MVEFTVKINAGEADQLVTSLAEYSFSPDINVPVEAIEG
jgi:hypothetical protein